MISMDGLIRIHAEAVASQKPTARERPCHTEKKRAPSVVPNKPGPAKALRRTRRFRTGPSVGSAVWPIRLPQS